MLVEVTVKAQTTFSSRSCFSCINVRSRSAESRNKTFMSANCLVCNMQPEMQAQWHCKLFREIKQNKSLLSFVPRLSLWCTGCWARLQLVRGAGTRSYWLISPARRVFSSKPASCCCSQLIILIIRIIKNYDNVYGVIITIKVTARVHQVHLINVDWVSSDRWQPTPRPSQSTWAASLPKTGSYHPHPPSPLLLLLSP